ncbi:TniQ family protein [Streptomyces globisporus]|uniref:TniQ family protein n=1 Tax=Streptomyces globisporus TaxID=1908 RepID=UPI003800220C
MTRRPLSRSLDPLADETLVGFLLRLARHNGTTPAQIAARMGLMDPADGTPGIVSPWLLADMDKPRLVRVARAAHLTVPEASKLLLAPMGHRYGIVSRRYQPWTTPQQLDRPNRWVFMRTSQFCPPCLAGDDDPLGLLYGGAWKRSWRLPMVFACSGHQRLLSSICPECRTPGQYAAKGLIARASAEDLHPAQCRATAQPNRTGEVRRSVCGSNLARIRPPRPPGDADSLSALLALQQRLDVLLSADGPQKVNSCGQLVPVAQYFIDLRVVATLVLASWPEANAFAATPTLAQAIGREAEQRLRDSRRRTSGASKRPFGISSLLSPLESPLTMGAVLGIAERLLDGRERRWTGMVVGPLYDSARTLHRDTFQKLARLPGTSSGLQGVLGVAKETTDSANPEIYIRGPRNG